MDPFSSRAHLKAVISGVGTNFVCTV